MSSMPKASTDLRPCKDIPMAGCAVTCTATVDSLSADSIQRDTQQHTLVIATQASQAALLEAHCTATSERLAYRSRGQPPL